MKVKDVRLHLEVWDEYMAVRGLDQHDTTVFRINWGMGTERTKAQAIAIAKRLCDRFNAGQKS